MNRLLGLFLALGLGLWAQFTLTGDNPGIPRDALILFIGALVLFVWNAQAPRPFRTSLTWRRLPWRRQGWLLSLVGLGLGIISLLLLWLDLGSRAGLLLWPVATILFVAGTFFEEAEDREQGGGNQEEEDGESEQETGFGAWIGRHWEAILLILILMLAAAVRLYQLDLHPSGCQSDECNNGLDALRWMSGSPYLPYAETNEGQATFFTYLIALSFQVFGVGMTQMRFVSAAVGVLTVLALYFLARDLYGPKAALVAAALLATSRWHVTFSRIVYELIMQPLFMILIVFFMLRGLRSGRRRDWALAGVSLAAGMNTYTAFRVVPILLALFFLYWLVRSWIRERQRVAADVQGIAIMGGGAVLAGLPLMVYILQNWQVFVGRIQHVSIMSEVGQRGSFQPVFENLRKTLTMFNWQGDPAPLNNLPGAAMLGALVAVLFVLGLGYSLWYALRGRPVSVLFMLWFIAIASLGVLSVSHEAPTARRTIGLIPLVFLQVALVTDQFFISWQQTWKGLGERVLMGATAMVVVLVSILNIGSFFSAQALNPDVLAAYSPNESAIGRYLTTLSPDTTVLITPQYEHHSAVRFIGRDHPYRGLDATVDVPFLKDSGGDLVYILDPIDEPTLELLKQIYPGGRPEHHAGPNGYSLFLSFRVPRADLVAARGIMASYYPGYPPSQAPIVRQTMPTLDVDMGDALVEPPYFTVLSGTLLVPEYGEYTFDLLSEGDSASLQIGNSSRLEMPEGGSGSLSVTLPAGFHPIRLEVASGEQPGRLALTWTGPGFEAMVLSDRQLFTFELGGNGLIGYYYANADWQGQPVLVRNDRLVLANNALPEPFSIAWHGKIAIPETGTYVFGTRSDDGSFVFIDGQLVVDNGGIHGAEGRQGSIHLDKGFHDLEVRYNDVGGSREMQFWWQPPGQGQAMVTPEYLIPLEAEAIPEGLVMPPLPAVERSGGGLEPDAGAVTEIAPSRPDTGVVAGPVANDLPQLEAKVRWRIGSCGSGENQFSSPRGVAVDLSNGSVYVADTGNFRIVVLGEQGVIEKVWGGQGEGVDQFQEPVDLVVEPAGSILVLDAVGQRLLRFDPGGEFVETFGAEQAFYRPRGVGIDLAGQLEVADTGGLRIVGLDASGERLNQVGGPESEIASRQPTDAVASSGGDLYFVEAENGLITQVTAGGMVQKWGGPVPSSTIEGPHLALRPAGGLYCTDPEGRRILLFNPDGTPSGQFGAGDGLIKPVGIAAVPVAEGGSDLVVVADSQGCQVVVFEVSP
ncbi:MAG: glycosyltransferase family 39 protein [Chloroflexota bacterium]|nr:glycosyltransferase family 39 protein [Chloroflexota bacterium]